MANMVIPNEGKLLALQMIVGNAASITEDFVCDLYTNNYTPVDGSTSGNFVPATGGGYAQASVPRSTFGSPVIVSNVAQITATPAPTFTCTSGTTQTIYGWYMRGATSGKVYAAQLFPTPGSFTPGVTISLYPFTFDSDSFTS